MSKQIQIRWESGLGGNYDTSVEALRQYRPQPSIKASLSIKGDLPEEAIKAIIGIVEDYDDVTTLAMLTATWSDEDQVQLRLFGPQAVMFEEQAV